METMKVSLAINIENLQHDLESFAATWKDLASKPTSGQLFENGGSDLRNYLNNIKEKRKECNDMLERKEKLLENCGRLNMVFPEFPELESVAKELIKQEATWKLFEEFYNGNNNH